MLRVFAVIGVYFALGWTGPLQGDPTLGLDPRRCAEVLAGLEEINPPQRAFLGILSEVTGQRALRGYEGHHPWELSWPGYEGGLRARVVFQSESGRPRISTSKGERTLFLPSDFAGLSEKQAGCRGGF